MQRSAAAKERAVELQKEDAAGQWYLQHKTSAAGPAPTEEEEDAKTFLFFF